MRFLHLLLPLILFCATPASFAATMFEGRVTRVKDGDSILVYRPDVKRTSEIRFAGMDAPEFGQPWGSQSGSALRRMIQGKNVRVEVTDRDRYGRLVGKVYLGRQYVNAEMVDAGHAWAFRRYLKDEKIRAAQIRAKKAGRGLWSLPEKDRVPPPTWRQTHPRRD